MAFGRHDKKKRNRIKHALSLRLLPASALVKMHSSPSEISHTHINSIKSGCFQIDLILFWVGGGFHLHNTFFYSLRAMNATTNQVVIGMKMHLNPLSYKQRY